jgi:hypothetical protein
MEGVRGSIPLAPTIRHLPLTFCKSCGNRCVMRFPHHCFAPTVRHEHAERRMNMRKHGSGKLVGEFADHSYDKAIAIRTCQLSDWTWSR